MAATARAQRAATGVDRTLGWLEGRLDGIDDAIAEIRADQTRSEDRILARLSADREAGAAEHRQLHHTVTAHGTLLTALQASLAEQAGATRADTATLLRRHASTLAWLAVAATLAAEIIRHLWK